MARSNDAVVRHFLRAGVILGPSRKETRHSDLSVIKTFLIGDQISFGYKAYNNFGSAVHHAWLLGRLGNWILTEGEKMTRSQMLQALNNSVLATKLLADCTDRERRRKAILNGVRIGFTPDANCKRKTKGIDLKTTSCGTLKDFIQKAFEYGYFRQGKTYMLAAGLKEFYIIGIQKKFPFQVFIVWLQSPEHRDWMEYVTEELKFLLYFYQNYGNPNYKHRAVA